MNSRKVEPGAQPEPSLNVGKVTDQQLSDAVNSGATSDLQGSAPSIPFQVLSRLKTAGADITPDLARSVASQASNIQGDPTLDGPGKQAALRQLVRANLPADLQPAPGDVSTNPGSVNTSAGPVQGVDTSSTARPLAQQIADTQTALDQGKVAPEAAGYTQALVDHLRGTLDVPQAQTPAATSAPTGIEPANGPAATGSTGSIAAPASATPRPVAPRQMESRTVQTPDGPLTLDPDTDKLAQVRQWIADERDAGRPPSMVDLVRKQRLPMGTAKRLVADQDNAEFAAAQKANGSGVPDDPARIAQNMLRVEAQGGDGMAWARSAIDEVGHGNREVIASQPGRDGDMREAIFNALPEPHRRATAHVFGQLETPLPPGTDAAGVERRIIASKYMTALAQRRAGQPLAESQFKDTRGLENLLDGPQPEIVEKQLAAAERLNLNPEHPEAPKPAPSVQRQPATATGLDAQRTIARLEALQRRGIALDGEQQRALAAARITLARDLNQQVLGADAKPNTLAGSRAVRTLQTYDAYQGQGKPMRPGDYAAVQAAHQAIQDDLTAQRQAVEAKSPPPAPVHAGPDDLTVGDKLQLSKSIPYEHTLTADDGGPKVTLTDPKGRTLNLARDLALKHRVQTQAESALVDPNAEPPIAETTALKLAQTQIGKQMPLLTRLGVKRVLYGPTQGGSGVEFSDDGALHINPAKLAQSMSAVRDAQSRNDLAGSPTGWFGQVLFHEGIHAADAAIAREKGQTMQQRYSALPNEAMPTGWQVAGRSSYGSEWDGLKDWQRKAEFCRQVLEGKWTGRISEAFHKFLDDIVTYLKKVAGFKGTDPRFQAHIAELDARLQAARGPSEDVAALAGDAAPAAAKAPRSFKVRMPYAPTGDADVLDHIVEQGGMVSPAKALATGRADRLAGDFDSAPKLGGFYHSAVFGGRMMPDQMAEVLHQDHGVGDGSTDGMWNAIGKAVDLRRAVAAEQQSHATLEKQANRFDKDAVQQSTAKGTTAINTQDLSVGDTVTVGNQTLKVIGLDPDTLDIELEDHSKYGVQKVADGQTLYVEKVDQGTPNTLGAARPSADNTLNLFPGEDEPFNLQGELASAGDRLATVRQRQQPAAPAGIPGLPDAQQTLASLTGNKITSRRTAFSADSGTLGIPRTDMPQVAAVHRGAMANFLNARGMSVSAGEVLPGELKPSQADFNPGKVAKAGAIREAGDANPRRILTSNDGRVIDGHHQWLDRLQNDPNTPMPVLKINAPARDILKQIHEFPSAGMEKAPDIEGSAVPTLRSGERQSDLLSKQAEDLRLVGERAVDHGARQQAQEAAAVQAAANKAQFDQDQQRLFAADPNAEHLDPAAVVPYLQSNGTPAERVADAASGIARSISRVAHGPMARSYGDFAQSLLDFGSHASPANAAPVPGDGRSASPTAQERASAKALTSLDPQQLRDAFARGATVSATIRRLINRQIPGFDVAGQTIATPADFAALLQPLRTPYFESLKVAFLDDANRIVHAQILHVGTLNESVASPRDILSSLQDAAAKTGGAGPRRAIISHNHPSGDPTPSHADTQMTSRLREVLRSQGVDLVDHVITNGKTYYSFTAGKEAPMPGGETLAAWEAMPRSALPKVNGPDQLARAVGALRQSSDGNTGHVLYLSTKYNLLGVERVPLNGLAISKLAVAGAAREGAHSVILDVPFANENDASAAVGGAKRALQATGVNLLDAATGQHASLTSSGMLHEAEPGEGGLSQTPDPSRIGTIKDLVDGALEPGQGERKRFVRYATVNPDQAQQLKTDTGLDLEGYQRNLDNSAVRHVWQQHGDPAREIARGNAPLTREDFEKLPELLDHPDASILAGKNRLGQDMILSAKRVNGYYIIAEEARTGSRVLSLTTMYKRIAHPPANDTAQGTAPLSTPEALRSIARSILQQVAEQHNFLHPGGIAETPAPVHAGPDDLAVGDKLDLTGQGVIHTLTADDGGPKVTLTGPKGNTLKLARDLALKKRVPPAAPDTLGAATPSADDDRSMIDRIFQPIKQARAKGKSADQIASRFDAADTLAGISGRQAGNSVRLDFPDAKDRAAASAVVEAGGQRKELAADLAKVKASTDPKLAAKYAPVYQHALDNLDRLKGATGNYNSIEAREMSAARNAGLDVKQRERYLAHAMAGLEDADGNPAPLRGSIGAAPGAGVPKLSDAISAGRDPGTMDLGDLTERRVAANQRLIQQKAFQGGLAGMKASDGKPVLSAITENSSAMNPDGSVTSTLKVPTGYEAVQAGDNVLTVHKEFAPILKALYGESAIRQSKLGNALLNAAALAKHGTAVLDTYHAMRVLTKEVLGFQTAGYGKGLAPLDYTDADLPRAVAAGEITQKEADYAQQSRPIVDKLLAAGLNTGKVSDNLLEAAKQHNLIEGIPVIGGPMAKLNEFIFHHLQRGVMTQAGIVAYNRNKLRFPDLSDEEVARRSAKETNEFFGNLGNQGFLKSKTMQDVARLTLFAPQWTESQLRSEVRGAAQAAQVPLDGVRGKGWRVGVVAQAIGGAVVSALIANQLLNMFTRGKPTWENPEEGHKWDAWIPGAKNGFFFSPLSIAAEYSHALLKYMGGGESAIDAAAHIASNKLSGGARAVKDLVTGKDYQGKPFASTAERLKAAAADALPLPIPAGPFIVKDPKAPLGYALNHQSGALEKQLLAMAGMKVENAPSARTQMYQIAQPFRAPQPGGQQEQHTSPYTDLRHALTDQDQTGAAAEINRLVTEEHKPLQTIAKALGLKDDLKSVRPELFTGSLKTERAMIDQLTPEQRHLWVRAQGEHAANALLFAGIAAAMLKDPESGRALAIANLENKRGVAVPPSKPAQAPAAIRPAQAATKSTLPAFSHEEFFGAPPIPR